MDLRGLQKISEALTMGLQYGPEKEHVHHFYIDPPDYDFTSEEGTPPRVERVRYIDVFSYAAPSMVLEGLRNANLLEPTGMVKGIPEIQLRLLAINTGAGNSTLSFEDLAER